MRLKPCIEARQAFTRTELVVVILTTLLLGTIAFSVLGNTFTRTDLAVCSNNLRQIGRAFHMWASDHGGENPWWTHYNSGGSYIPIGGPLPPGNIYNLPGYGPMHVGVRNNAWLQFGFIGEELRTPMPLVCPSDRIKFRAREFSINTTNGFYSQNFQNKAVSYFVGMHALRQFPSTMLSGDWSIQDDGQDTACPVNAGVISRIQFFSSHGWSTNLHPISGNLLFNDGRVEEMTAPRLNKYLGPQNDDGGYTHLIKPTP